jgi:hypothetical protein
MFKTRARDTDGMAAATWHELVSSLSSARDNATDTMDHARGKFNGVGHEARRRAGNALDAISGKPQPSRWPYVVGAIVGGAFIGYAAAQLLRQHPVDEAVAAVRNEAGKVRSAVEARLQA